jgi:hypothetical protein
MLRNQLRRQVEIEIGNGLSLHTRIRHSARPERGPVEGPAAVEGHSAFRFRHIGIRHRGGAFQGAERFEP